MVENDRRLIGFGKGIASDRELGGDKCKDRSTFANRENGWNTYDVCVWTEAHLRGN